MLSLHKSNVVRRIFVGRRRFLECKDFGVESRWLDGIDTAAHGGVESFPVVPKRIEERKIDLNVR